MIGAAVYPRKEVFVILGKYGFLGAEALGEGSEAFKYGGPTLDAQVGKLDAIMDEALKAREEIHRRFKGSAVSEEMRTAARKLMDRFKAGETGPRAKMKQDIDKIRAGLKSGPIGHSDIVNTERPPMEFVQQDRANRIEGYRAEFKQMIPGNPAQVTAWLEQLAARGDLEACLALHAFATLPVMFRDVLAGAVDLEALTARYRAAADPAKHAELEVIAAVQALFNQNSETCKRQLEEIFGGHLVGMDDAIRSV